MNSLYIDTHDRSQTEVSIKTDKGLFKVKSFEGQAKSQVTLALIKDVLKKAGLQVSDIDTIEVNRGPGSFTGLRVGLIIANTLALLLKKKVNGLPKSTIILPAYE